MNFRYEKKIYTHRTGLFRSFPFAKETQIKVKFPITLLSWDITNYFRTFELLLVTEWKINFTFIEIVHIPYSGFLFFNLCFQDITIRNMSVLLQWIFYWQYEWIKFKWMLGIIRHRQFLFTRYFPFIYAKASFKVVFKQPQK